MFKDLLLIILGIAFSYAYFYWQLYKDKKEIRKQERLNAIKRN
jgi:cbb3-type cytochrome oxidase subunit 3